MWIPQGNYALFPVFIPGKPNIPSETPSKSFHVIISEQSLPDALKQGAATSAGSMARLGQSALAQLAKLCTSIRSLCKPS